jgi:hypothetical protein
MNETDKANEKAAYAPSLDARNNDVLARIEKMGNAQQAVLVKEMDERAKLPPGIQMQAVMGDQMDRKAKQYVAKGQAGKWVTMDKEHMEAAASRGYVPVRDATGDVVLGGKTSLLMSRPEALTKQEIEAMSAASRERLNTLDQRTRKTAGKAATDINEGLQVTIDRVPVGKQKGG